MAAAAKLPRVRLINVHALGGVAMMKAAREALGGKKRRPALLGVTILTSMDEAALAQVGISGPPETRVVALAQLAQQAGLDGVVASAQEAAAIRAACGPKFLIVVPGVRPAGADLNDQSRVATPAGAIRAGASYLVVGRPIAGAAKPREAALAIAREIAGARGG